MSEELKQENIPLQNEELKQENAPVVKEETKRQVKPIVTEGMSWEERYRIREEERKRQRAELEKKDAAEFHVFGIASIIYAVIFVVCLYKNFSGVTNPIWAMATVGYMVYIAKKLEKKWKIMNTFISIIIVLLGISNFVTGNGEIIFFNYLAMICLIAANMMYLFFNTKNVNVTRHLLLLLQLMLGVFAEMAAPFRQLKAFLKKNKIKKSDKTVYVIVGIVVAVPVFFIMLGILASADEVFKTAIGSLTDWLSLDTIIGNIIGILIMLAIGYIVPYAFSKYINSGKASAKEGKCAENEPIIAVIVTGVVSLLYVIFSVIQIVYLFMGKGTLPEDYSYAQYAREGFFQLLFVSIFNAVMVLVCIEFFKKSRVLKGILTVVSLCTFVMIASSAYRMGMYIHEYGLTFTRIFVLWALAVITLIMLGLVYQIFREKFNLFKYSLIVISICFTALSLSHVDYYIAKYDLDMYAQMKGHTPREIVIEDDYDGADANYDYVDYGYIMELSTDAAPAIAKHMDEIRKYMQERDIDINEVNWSYYYYWEDGYEYNKMTIRNFNVSRYLARLSVKNAGK